MSRQVVLHFPTEFPDNSIQDQDALKKGKEAMVLELLRKGRISQGKAAELLEIDRWTLSDLMAKYDLPAANFSPAELRRQRKDAEKTEQRK